MDIFDATKELLGPSGGQLAIAFGAGCAAGYAFCLRTVHKMLRDEKEFQHTECLRRIEKLEEDKDELKARIVIVEERWLHGNQRQSDQVRVSGNRLIERLKGDDR